MTTHPGGGSGTGPGGGGGTGPGRAELDEPDTQTPARRIQPLAGSIATNGGPARTTRPTSGDRPTPGSAASREEVSKSDGAVVAPVAGASFRLPPTPLLPRFAEGEHRLVGRVTHP